MKRATHGRNEGGSPQGASDAGTALLPGCTTGIFNQRVAEGRPEWRVERNENVASPVCGDDLHLGNVGCPSTLARPSRSYESEVQALPEVA